MLTISESALREGCERAHDLFKLNRLRDFEAASDGFTAVFAALGIDGEKRAELERALVEMLPFDGLPVAEAAMVSSMMSGVLVGLMIADSALPADEFDFPLAET